VKKRELIAYLVPNIFASCLVAAGILVQILILINSRKFTLFMDNLVTQSRIINLAPTIRYGLDWYMVGMVIVLRPNVSAKNHGLAYSILYGINNEQK